MKSKRFFTNEEIEKWNVIISKGYHKYKLGVHSGTKSLLVYEQPGWGYKSGTPFDAAQRRDLKDIIEHNKYSPFNYNFSFSVIKRRKDEFFNILDKFIECGIHTGEDKPIIDLKKAAYDFKMTEHTIGKNELIRVQYSFTNLLSAMFITTLIEDTISFFELIWGYTDDGEEQCLLKYPIGSVVSLKGKKGIDYMVNGYEFLRVNSEQFSYNIQKPLISKPDTTKSTILYDLVCIESGINSGIVRYGESCIAQESDIVPSRTNNLNIILN
jgi:hypothetical protein